ncbi:MAG TPA: hypothetical protein VIT65_05835 [Microlunatus sp.]
MISRPIRAAAAAVASAAAVALGLFATLPAQADAAADADADGKVVAAGGLTVRQLPTTASTSKGKLANGTTVSIICKVRGSSVDGNNLWYLLPPTLNEWISARYVRNVGAAPGWCGDDERFIGRTTTAVTKRVAPTTAASTAGGLAAGARVSIICKLPGQSVGGNNRWYYLTDGRWVSARYVTNVGRAPGWCS